MLEEKDLQAIGKLFDEKLDKRLDQTVSEIGEIISEGFSMLEAKINERPTRNEIFGWADRRIDDLEIRADRHDYLHLNELDKLPSRSEISKTLIEYKEAHRLV